MAEFQDYGQVDGFMAVMIALLFFGTVYALEALRTGIWFRPCFRGLLGDYAYPVCRLVEWAPRIETYSVIDCNYLLDWILAYTRNVEEIKHPNLTPYASVFSDHRTELACRFLAFARQVGICRYANRFSNDVAFLL